MKMRPLHTMAYWLLAATVAFVAGCGPDDEPAQPKDEPIAGEYNPQPFSLSVPSWMPFPIIPEDNPLTVQGIELGRRLFYDPILSADSTLSCAGCHQQSKAFTDGRARSRGIRGMETRRSSMSIANLAFHSRELFWDGRVKTLEELALIPVEDPVEMNDTWPNVLQKLRRHPDYPRRFREAFGIGYKSQITKELAAKAMAQFMRTLISANSRYDKVVWRNQGWFTDEEERGRQLFFFEESQQINHPGCSHCHFAPTFGNNPFNTYTNNGLQAVPNLDAFPDRGRGEVTGNRFDNGRFRVVSLRNIELTAPYMHDGRFRTLEEVIDNYSRGGHGVENEDTNILPFTLTAREKADLIAFLKTLTDQDFVTNPAYSNPFR